MRTSSAVILALFFVATAQCFEDEYYEAHPRFPRGSVGVYSGFINGQHYGGSYHAPDDGPPVVHRYGPNTEPHRGSSNHKPNIQNRFGDAQNDPPRRPGGSGSFSGASAGSYSGSGGNFGGGGVSFGGSGGSFNSQPGYYPFPNAQAHPFKSPYEFNDFLQSFFNTLNNNLASAFKQNQDIQRNAFMAAQQAFHEASKQRFGGVPNLNYGGASGGAFSSASVGAGGGSYSAGTYPENPSKPNIHNRFSNDDNSRPGKPGNVVGISTSAFSSSSDVNGKKTSHKQATTSINENGKVTTYTVESRK